MCLLRQPFCVAEGSQAKRARDGGCLRKHLGFPFSSLAIRRALRFESEDARGSGSSFPEATWGIEAKELGQLDHYNYWIVKYLQIGNLELHKLTLGLHI